MSIEVNIEPTVKLAVEECNKAGMSITKTLLREVITAQLGRVLAAVGEVDRICIRLKHARLTAYGEWFTGGHTHPAAQAIERAISNAYSCAISSL